MLCSLNSTSLFTRPAIYDDLLVFFLEWSLQIFADMEELGIKPTVPIVTMVGDSFKKLDMMDKYEKLNRKYPPPKWEFRYVKGKRIKIRSKYSEQSEGNSSEVNSSDLEASSSSDELELHEKEVSSGNFKEENNLYLPEITYSPPTD